MQLEAMLVAQPLAAVRHRVGAHAALAARAERAQLVDRPAFRAWLGELAARQGGAR